MPTATTKEIIIDLDKLDTSEVLNENEYINGIKLEELKKIIIDTVKNNTEHLDKIAYNAEDAIYSKKPYDDIFVPIQQNPCFLIHGSRGSGKSTMLRKLRKELIVPKEDEDIPKIKLLADIDPTSFAQKESFFIYILAKIAEKLNGHLDINGLTNDYKSAICKKAINILHEMSNGLKMLHDTKEDFHKSADAVFFIEDSVRKSASSDKLRQKFHDILENLCLLEHTKALLITIDDSDLNPQKCSEIFETVRNYMLSPRIIIVFAGDLPLYSQIIRGMMISHFKALSLQDDEARKAHRDELLNHFEDQYLLKLIPAENRINLRNFDEVLTDGTIQYFLKYRDGNHEMRKYISMCTELLYPEEYTHNIIDILPKQPARSLLQLLKCWVKDIPEKADKLLETGEKKEVTHERVSAALAEGLKKVLTQTLIHNRINFSEIHKSAAENMLLKEILLHITELGALPGSSSLTSSIGSQPEKLVSAYLNAETLHYINSYYRLLHYTLFINTNIYYIKKLYFKNSLSSSTNKEDIKNRVADLYYSAINQENNPRSQWHTAFIIKSLEETEDIRFNYGIGIIRILSFSLDPQEEGIYKLLLSTVNEVRRNKELHEPFYLFIQAIYHSICVISTEKGSAYYFSIYSLLRLITNCLYISQRYSAREVITYLLKVKTPFSSCRTQGAFDSTNVQEKIHKTHAYSAYFKYITDKFEQYNAKLNRSVFKWANNHTNLNTFCYPSYIDNAWHNFIERCDISFHNILVKKKPVGIGENKSVGIGELFAAYLDAFSEAIRYNLRNNNLGENVNKCLTEFPLWKAIMDERRANSPLWQALNEIKVEPNPEDNIQTKIVPKQDTNTSGNDIRQLLDLLTNISSSLSTMKDMITQHKNAAAQSEATPKKTPKKTSKTTRKATQAATPEAATEATPKKAK